MHLVACCDINPDNLAAGMKLAAKGAKAYTDYRKLLDDKNVNAVIIATPLYLHYPMAVDALSAGKHIYLEKSMTYNIDQAIDLVKKVRQSKLIFQVGYQYRNLLIASAQVKNLFQMWKREKILPLPYTWVIMQRIRKRCRFGRMNIQSDYSPLTEYN